MVLKSGAGTIGALVTVPKSQETASVEGAGDGLTAAKIEDTDSETRGSGLVIRDSSDPSVGGAGPRTLAGKEGTAIDAVELVDVDAAAHQDVGGGGRGVSACIEGCEAWVGTLVRRAGTFAVVREDVVTDVDGFGAVFRVNEIGGLAFKGAEMPAMLLGRSAASLLR